MNKLLQIATCLACLITVTAAANPSNQVNASANRFMASFDRNGDGIVSKGEVPKNI